MHLLFLFISEVITNSGFVRDRDTIWRRRVPYVVVHFSLSLWTLRIVQRILEITLYVYVR